MLNSKYSIKPRNKPRGTRGLLKKERIMEYAEVTDLYEAAYLVTQGSRVEEVSCIPLSESLSCSITLSGEDLEGKQGAFQLRQAVVNLHAFRTAYNQVNKYVHEAKKNYDRERRRNRQGPLGLQGGRL